MAARKRSIRRSRCPGSRRSRSRRFRDPSGVVGCGVARDGSRRRTGRDDVAVFVAGSLFARGRGVKGSGPDCTGGGGGGVGGLGRGGGSAGFVGARVGGSPSLGGAVVDASGRSSGRRRGLVRRRMVAGVGAAHWYWR